MNRKLKTVLLIVFVMALLFAAATIVCAVTGFTFFQNDEEQIEATAGEEQNILVLGLDSRNGEKGRTDTIMVVNVDPEKGKLSLLSIPRDTRVLLNGSHDRINAAYVYGGIDMVKSAVEDLLDIEIDHYAIIDFQGFIEIVDLFGGVEVDVPVRMYHPKEGIDLQPGVQVLDGKDALGFARYRYTKNGDLDRAKHQQEILEALKEKALRLENIPKIPELIGIISAYIDTDVSKTEMLKIAGWAERFRGQKLSASTLPGEAVKIDGLWYYTAYEDQMEEITIPFKKDEV